MRDTMRHRGPDDAGEWWSDDGCVGLAQRRLAIIDLSPAGHQPMSDVSGRLWVTFNGEIYNYRELKAELEQLGHRFRSASDTEVLLEAYRAWGTDCLRRLNGMFAFSLYDSCERTLFLARDRAGEKPLFYTQQNGRFAFASELKALMADSSLSRVLNPQALDHYLAYGYVPGQMCILQRFNKLGQGQAMIYQVDSGETRVWTYWQLPPPEAPEDCDGEGLTEELERLLEDSVRRQLIADVPIGVMLSGGVDSSLITAMAARVSNRTIKTFTVSFPGHERYDEALHARIVASHFGTEHAELIAEPASLDLLPMLAHQYDEPMADSSMIPTFLVARLIRQQATVALGGDGGDELFGGYLHYSWAQQLDRFRRLTPGPLRAAAGWLARNVMPVGVHGRNYFMASAAEAVDSLALINLIFDRVSRRRLLSRDWRIAVDSGPERYKVDLCCTGRDLVEKGTAMDFRSYLADDILVKVDRASMLNSLEVRAPFLDYRIIEFAFGRVPSALRATIQGRKILLRRLARRLLPPALDISRKQGLSLPLEAWFSSGWRQFLEDVLYQENSRLFDSGAIRRLITGQAHGYANNIARLFTLMFFELWRREYRVNV